MEQISTGNFLGSSLGVREQDETALESIQFNEEIQGLIAPASENASSFTALLELPPTQAMELLHLTECQGTTTAASSSGKPLCPINDQKPHIVPSFKGNLAFECAAKYSVFGGENSLQEEARLVPPNSCVNLDKVKNEPPEIDSSPSSTQDFCDPPMKNKNQRAAKRKEREKKVKGPSKKCKSVADENPGDAEKLPYVHVRVRRGQATDSHSLAERARREKINARMKLLQELVPGCNKISGTALVLDEIINHVQFLQRQVEILSMKLATVNPRIDFSLDSILATEGASLMDNNFPSMVAPLVWPEISTSGNGQQHQQPRQFDTLHQPLWGKEEENPNFMTPENSLVGYDSSTNSGSLHLNQLKMEL